MTRDDLEQKLREIITGCPVADGSCADCHCTGNAAVYRAIAAVDIYLAELGVLPEEFTTTELWDAETVRKYVGLKDSNAGRTWCSRNKIQRVTSRPNPNTGRLMALYNANEVRAAHIRKSTT